MSQTETKSTVLLKHHLKILKLPTIHAQCERIAEHEHCRRIAGDDSTPPPFAVAIPSPARFDAQVHPSKLHTILPCDSNQLAAARQPSDGIRPTSSLFFSARADFRFVTPAVVFVECWPGAQTPSPEALGVWLHDGKPLRFTSPVGIVSCSFTLSIE